MAIETRPLGGSSLRVPPLCFGGNVFGWTVDEAASFRLLDALLDHGLNFIDTADMYSRWVPGHSGGESETIIGRWMRERGNRARVVIATKVGMDMGEGRVGLRPDYIAQAIDASLRRLGTDHVDLYQSHKDDPATPLAETLGAYARLIEAGKVRVIGASNYSATRLDEALRLAKVHGLPRYESLQPLYNLYDRIEYEPELAAICGREDLAVVPFSSLASGFLTGKYRDVADAGKSQRGQGIVDRYLDDRGRRILAALDEVAGAHGTSQAAVALSWLMRQPTVTAPIASATSPDQLGELVAAVRLDLSQDDLARLGAASA